MLCYSGLAPTGIHALGADVWRADKPPAEQWLLVLGSWAIRCIVGGTANADRVGFAPAASVGLAVRVAAPHDVCFAAGQQRLFFTRLRTVPLLAVAPYAQAQDDAISETLQLCLGGIPPDDVQGARNLATLPAALGGLGLTSTTRTAPAAYWGRLG